jgi:hypothetical protein
MQGSAFHALSRQIPSGAIPCGKEFISDFSQNAIAFLRFCPESLNFPPGQGFNKDSQ